MELLIGFSPFLLMAVIYGVLSLIGMLIENRFEANLERREAALGTFPIMDLSKPIGGANPVGGELVVGNVVMGTGYLKQLMAQFRQFFGGEVKGFQRVMNNGRREAQLRMIESAVAQGGTSIINVRFETSDVGGKSPVAEVFCYGTMLR